MYESSDKMVSHPDHYQSETGLEVIDVIEAFTFDLKGIEATDTGNILKYMCRWKSKNGLQDLEKAQWYLTHLIDHVRKLEEENRPLEKCKRNYNDVLLNTRKETEDILDWMLRVTKQEGVITVADLYALLGRPTDYLNDTIGWNYADVVGATPSISGDRYILGLPNPRPIENILHEKESK